MTRSVEPVEPGPDVRGRVVVWSAGTVRSGGAGHGRHRVWRGLGLVLAATASVFSLAYAVHAWVVLAPLPASSSVPLWLPDQLPVDEAADPAAGPDVRHPSPTSRPSPTRTEDVGAVRRPTVPARPAASGGPRPRPSVTKPKASGHGPARSSGSGDDGGSSGSSGSSGHDGSGHSSSGSTSSGSDDSGHGGSPASGGGSSGSSSSGSGSSDGGSSGGGSSHGGSGHGGSDDGGSGHGGSDHDDDGDGGGGSGHGGSDGHDRRS